MLEVCSTVLLLPLFRLEAVSFNTSTSTKKGTGTGGKLCKVHVSSFFAPKCQRDTTTNSTSGLAATFLLSAIHSVLPRLRVAFYTSILGPEAFQLVSELFSEPSFRASFRFRFHRPGPFQSSDVWSWIDNHREVRIEPSSDSFLNGHAATKVSMLFRDVPNRFRAKSMHCSSTASKPTVGLGHRASRGLGTFGVRHSPRVTRCCLERHRMIEAGRFPRKGHESKRS